MRLRVSLFAGFLVACGAAEERPAPAASVETVGLRFALCASNVVSVDLAESPGAERFAVHVGLSPEATAAFAQLTGDNVGRDLAVVYGDEIFLAAPIPGRIASGVITAAPLEAQDAERVQRALAALPERPCGSVSGAGS